MCNCIGNGNRLGLLSQLSLLNPFARRNDRHSYLGDAFVFSESNQVNLTIFKPSNFYSVTKWKSYEHALEEDAFVGYVDLIKKEGKAEVDNVRLEKLTSSIMTEVARATGEEKEKKEGLAEDGLTEGEMAEEEEEKEEKEEMAEETAEEGKATKPKRKHAASKSVKAQQKKVKKTIGVKNGRPENIHKMASRRKGEANQYKSNATRHLLLYPHDANSTNSQTEQEHHTQ